VNAIEILKDLSVTLVCLAATWAIIVKARRGIRASDE